jgi:SGNH domain (fused to AT3 domains)
LYPQSVAMWDPFPTLCPQATCNAMDGKRPIFFDGDHLSAYGNARLYPEFRALLAPKPQPY